MTREEKRDALQKASDSIERAITECSVMAVKDQPAFMQAIRMAHGIRMIRGALTEEFVKQNFMPLQGTPLGFLTDKDSGQGYAWEVVRDVLCEALLRGFRPVGNEFNIISGRFYGAKAGFERIVHEFPGVSDVRIELGVPAMTDKGALVPCEISWTLHGRRDGISCVQMKDGLDTRIPVRVNSGMTIDAVLGKATRKLYARAYQRLTGSSRDVIDADPDELPRTDLPPVVNASQDGRRIKLGAKATVTAPVSEYVDPETGEVKDAEPPEAAAGAESPMRQMGED